MRLSVLKDDYAFNEFTCFYAKVFIDGKESDRCVTADEERGYYVVYDDNFENLIEKFGKVKIYVTSEFIDNNYVTH